MSPLYKILLTFIKITCPKILNMFDFRVTFDKTESFTASVASKFQICEMGMLIKRKVTTDFITLITFSTAFTNLNYIVSVPRRDRKAADIIPLCIPVEKGLLSYAI